MSTSLSFRERQEQARARAAEHQRRKDAEARALHQRWQNDERAKEATRLAEERKREAEAALYTRIRSPADSLSKEQLATDVKDVVRTLDVDEADERDVVDALQKRYGFDVRARTEEITDLASRALASRRRILWTSAAAVAERERRRQEANQRQYEAFQASARERQTPEHKRRVKEVTDAAVARSKLAQQRADARVRTTQLIDPIPRPVTQRRAPTKKTLPKKTLPKKTLPKLHALLRKTKK